MKFERCFTTGEDGFPFAGGAGNVDPLPVNVDIGQPESVSTVPCNSCIAGFIVAVLLLVVEIFGSSANSKLALAVIEGIAFAVIYELIFVGFHNDSVHRPSAMREAGIVTFSGTIPDRVPRQIFQGFVIFSINHHDLIFSDRDKTNGGIVWLDQNRARSHGHRHFILVPQKVGEA